MSEFKNVQKEINRLEYHIIHDELSKKGNNLLNELIKLTDIHIEMLDLLDRILKGKFNVNEIEQLIKKATS